MANYDVEHPMLVRLVMKRQNFLPLHNESYEHRVPKIQNKILFCTRDVCLFICLFIWVIQHRNWPLRSTILNAHGTVLTGSVHAHILTKPSRAGFAVISLELIEPGAATCVYRHAWAVF